MTQAKVNISFIQRYFINFISPISFEHSSNIQEMFQ